MDKLIEVHLLLNSYQAHSKEVEDKFGCLGLFVLDGSFFFEKL